MEKLGKQKLSDAVPQQQPKASGGMGRQPKPPQQEQAEQTPDAEETLPGPDPFGGCGPLVECFAGDEYLGGMSRFVPSL